MWACSSTWWKGQPQGRQVPFIKIYRRELLLSLQHPEQCASHEHAGYSFLTDSMNVFLGSVLPFVLVVGRLRAESVWPMFAYHEVPCVIDFQ